MKPVYTSPLAGKLWVCDGAMAVALGDFRRGDRFWFASDGTIATTMNGIQDLTFAKLYSREASGATALTAVQMAYSWWTRSPHFYDEPVMQFLES